MIISQMVPTTLVLVSVRQNGATVSNEITLGDTNVTKFRILALELHLVITHLLQMVMYLLTVVLLER